MNRRFTFRGLLGLVLIVISSFLGYNWLTGGSTESADTSPCSQADIKLGGKVLFCDVRLYDADSAIYTNAMENSQHRIDSNTHRRRYGVAVRWRRRCARM